MAPLTCLIISANCHEGHMSPAGEPGTHHGVAELQKGEPQYVPLAKASHMGQTRINAGGNYTTVRIWEV